MYDNIIMVNEGNINQIDPHPPSQHYHVVYAKFSQLSLKYIFYISLKIINHIISFYFYIQVYHQ